MPRYRRRYTPRRSYGRRRTYRRNFTRRRAYWRQGTGKVTKGNQGPIMLADKTFTKLRFNEQSSLTLSAEKLDSVAFIANGFDNSAIESEYAAGLFTWGQFYTRFRVYATKIKVTFINNGTTGLTAGVIPTTPSNTFTLTDESLKDQTYSRWKYLGSANGPSRSTMSMTMKTKKMFGQKVSQEEDFAGNFTYTAGTNIITGVMDPSSKWAYTLFIVSTTNQTTSVDYDMTLTYYVQFESRRPQTTVLPETMMARLSNGKIEQLTPEEEEELSSDEYSESETDEE